MHRADRGASANCPQCWRNPYGQNNAWDGMAGSGVADAERRIAGSPWSYVFMGLFLRP
jgi:hypothetical protein